MTNGTDRNALSETGDLPKDPVERAYTLDGQADRIGTYYADWARGYDKDLQDHDYRGPENLAALLASLAETYPEAAGPGATVLDVGCGTGLVGAALATRGRWTVDGIDLTEAMVDVARETGAYRNLTGGVDITAGLPQLPSNTYDIALSCGVFTVGHVPPQAIDPLLRVTRPGGLILLTTPDAYLEETGFADYVSERARAGDLRLVERRRQVPHTTEGPADHWILEPLR